MEEIEKLAPRNPVDLRLKNFCFSTREDALAWMLSALARRYVYYQRYDFPRNAMFDLPIHTWVLKPSPAEDQYLGKLKGDDPANDDYRILLHKTPSSLEGKRLIEPWPFIHTMLRKKKPELSLPRGRIGRSTMDEVSPFLKDVLIAYQNGTTSVQGLLKERGHDYWYSEGLPTP